MQSQALPTTKTPPVSTNGNVHMFSGDRSAAYFRLDEHLEMLMGIVPASGVGMERTTILTWLYRRRGVMSFLDIVQACDGAAPSLTRLKRDVRLTIKGMWRIGAVEIHTPENLTTVEGPLRDNDIAINRYSTVLLATGGMIWLQRAWQARSSSMRKQTSRMSAIHETYLYEEEEDSRSGDPYWLQKVSVGAGEGDSGQETAWVGAGVNSVFSLAQVVWQQPSKKRL
jgi:hypothetical protein